MTGTPVIASYLCFFAMIYFTLTMFRDRSALRKRAYWERLLRMFGNSRMQGPVLKSDGNGETSGVRLAADNSFDENEDVVTEAEDHPLCQTRVQEPSDSYFTTVNWQPYVNFLVALFFFLFSIGISEKLVPNSVLFCGIALFFSVMCFFGLSDATEHLALIAMVANFISWFVVFYSFMSLSFVIVLKIGFLKRFYQCV